MTEIGTTSATGKPLTVGSLRRFIARCDEAGIPDSAEPDVRASRRGKLRSISASRRDGWWAWPPVDISDRTQP